MAGAFALPLALRFDSLAEGQHAPCPGIRSLSLQCRRLGELRRFYVDKLELPVLEESSGSLTFAAGGTRLKFTAIDSGEPYYHFAFNIPENKLPAAKEWMKPRAPLVKRPDGSDEYFFETWNAHSVYFLDPAGNILEFIARHNLANAAAGEFSVRDILYASEIALVVDEVAQAVEGARSSLGLEPFGGAHSDMFAAVGNDHRLLIVVKRGRLWLSQADKPARVFPTHALIHGERKGRLTLEALPYEVFQEAAS